ncbi:MAG: V-type ATP synthase subunit E [Anaerolineae bacterium]
MMVTVIGNGLESYLLRRTRNEVMRIIADAEHEAAELVAQAAEQAETMHGGAEDEARQRVAAMRQRLMARAQLEAREALLKAQEQMRERVWRVAASRLEALDASQSEEQRLQRLQTLALEAAEQLGGGELVLQVNERDAGLLTDSILDQWCDAWQDRLPGVKLALADDTASIIGGVILRKVGGRELVDNSYEQRLAISREALRGQVMDILTSTAGSKEA